MQWPSVTVGLAQDVEDAVIIDLDADGAKDVVSCCEGKKQSIVVHWSNVAEARWIPIRGSLPKCQHLKGCSVGCLQRRWM